MLDEVFLDSLSDENCNEEERNNKKWLIGYICDGYLEDPVV